MSVRLALPHEVEPIREIEKSAATKFHGTDFAFIAEGDPDDPDEVAAAISAGLAWVKVDASDRPVGFLTAMAIAEGIYLKEIDVEPSAQGSGIGRELIDALIRDARRRGAAAIWLRTFRDVPWNAPYYERIGFGVVPSSEPRSIAAAISAHEADIGIDLATRVTMRLDLS